MVLPRGEPVVWFPGGGGVLLDGIELWLRKVAGPLLMSLMLCGWGIARGERWLIWRVAAVTCGLAMIGVCLKETWKLIRDQEPAKARLDRLEAQEPQDQTRPLL